MRHQEGAPLPCPRAAQRHEQVGAARGDVGSTVDALVADDQERVRLTGLSERSGRRQRLQERLHLSLETAPDAALRPFEHRPARAALDARHQQQVAPLRREQAALGSGGRSARQRAQRQAARARRTQCLQRIDAVRRESRALGLRQRDEGARTRSQQQFLVLAGLPGRAQLVEPRQRAGHRAAVGEVLAATAQPVERLDAWKAHQRVLGAEVEFAQALERVLARLPRHGRIDDQQRVMVAAPARRDQQRARAEVTVTLEWRYAHEAHVLRGPQREQAAAGLLGTDHVIVSERSPVVAVGIGVDVADRMTRTGPERPLRACLRHRSPHPHQLRFLQRRRHEARRVGYDGDAAEDLLVLDVLGAARAHALHHEVEAVGLVGADVVVVHRGAQRLARARAQCRERQRFTVAGQRDGRRCAAVHDAHDHRVPATVVEELLDGVAECARLPEASEHLVELGEAAHGDRAIHRAAQRAADECGDCGRQRRDRAVRARPFRHDDAAQRTVSQTRAPACARRKLAQVLVVQAVVCHYIWASSRPSQVAPAGRAFSTWRAVATNSS